jgi:hypothetical protein
MSRNGVTIEKMPGMTKLVEQFLDEVYGAGGRQQYSYLSGVAHGETFAVNQFLDALFDDEAPSVARAVTLVLPRDMAIQLAGQLGRCCGYVHDELAKLLDPSESDTIGVRWAVARDTAFERLAEMDKSRSDA